MQEGKTKRKQISKSKKGMVSSTYRKQKCKHYNKGACTKGDECTYRHDFPPDSARKICKFFLSNACSRGTTCMYSHNSHDYPCKFMHFQGVCQFGPTCKFSHLDLTPQEKEEFASDLQEEILLLQKDGRLADQSWLNYLSHQQIEKFNANQENEAHTVNIEKPFESMKTSVKTEQVTPSNYLSVKITPLQSVASLVKNKLICPEEVHQELMRNLRIYFCS